MDIRKEALLTLNRSGALTVVGWLGSKTGDIAARADVEAFRAKLSQALGRPSCVRDAWPYVLN